MKIRYIKNYKDEYGFDFPKGCVAEHTEADCKARIALGVAEEAPEEAYSRRLSADAELSFDCVVPEAVEGPEGQQKPGKKG